MRIGEVLQPLIKRRDLLTLTIVTLILEVLLWVIWKIKIQRPQIPFYIPTILAPPKFTLLLLVLNIGVALEAIRHDTRYAWLLIGSLAFVQFLMLFLMFIYLRGAGFIT